MITTDNLYFLLLQVFSSGVAGYITNKYAVNMIFKEYTPLKIGGAVKKNKEKFIEEISDLVEKDIINSSTMKDSILSNDFKKTMELGVKDFLNRSLYDAFGDLDIGQIEGLDETINNGERLLRSNLSEILSKLFINIKEHISLEDLLSEKQISSIVDYIYEELNNNLSENNEIENLIIDLYKEQENICLNRLVSKETADKITRIISCEIMNSIDELLDSKKETKQIIDKMLSFVDIKSSLKDLQKAFGTKTIEEIITEDGLDKLSLITYENLDQLIKSDEGRKKINDIIQEGIISLKNIDLTIFEILPIHFGRTSSEYLLEVIKNITPNFVSWINLNKDKIDRIIDDSIIESIDNIDDELRKSMILKVKDTMLVDFSSKNQIVKKVSEFIESYVDNGELSSKLYEKIVKFLEETKIKDIVKILEDNNLLDNEKIADILLSKWDECGKDISRELLKTQSSKTINNIINQDFYRLFNKNIKPGIYELVTNNKDKIMSYLDSAIFNIVHSKVDNILESEIKSILTEDRVINLSKKLPIKLRNYFINKSSNYKKSMSNKINDIISEINLDDLIRNHEDKIISDSTEKIIEISKSYIDKYKTYKIRDIIKNVNENEDLINEITEKSYESVSSNLESIVDGNVKKIIYNNLIKLDEDEICNIAQSFMGNQLKPLSMFGAFLGCIVGLIFGLTMQNISGQYGFYNNISNTLIACLLLGGVGVMTNIIALWMIFCPYEKNKFVSKIPVFRIFSIGYIPAHKDSFASGMAQFIDKELLSGNRISNLFKEKRDYLKENMFNNIFKSNTLLNLIRTKKEKISRNLYSFILKISKRNSKLISNSLSHMLLQIDGNSIISNDKMEEKVKEFIDNINKYEDNVINYFEEKLKVNKSMYDVLSQDMIEVIDNKINSDISNTIKSSIEGEYIEKLIKNIILNNADIYRSLSHKNLNGVFSEKLFDIIGKNIKNDKNINLLLLKLKEILSENLDSYLNDKFNEEKRFDELFDGKIKNKIDKDIYLLTEKAIDKLSDYAKDNVDIISSLVIKIVRSNLNFFVKMAYDFADGDGLVKDVIENVIQNKLEDFLKEEQNEIAMITYGSIEKYIYSSKIKSLGISTKEINTNLLLDRFIYGLKESEQFKLNIYLSSDMIVDKVGNIKASQVMNALDINTIDEAYSKCENVIKALESNMIENLKQNINEASEFIVCLVDKNIMKKFYSISLVEISWEITREDINYLVDNLFKMIDSSETIHRKIIDICNRAYDLSIKNTKLADVLDRDILEDDLNKSLNIIMENKDFNERNKVVAEDILDLFTKEDIQIISPSLEVFVVNKLLDGMLDSTQRFIIPLLKSLDLQNITLKEVEHMHPKEIHMLFKSFAGDFFIKLYIYGSFGCIFGVNVYLSIILLLIDMVYSKKIDKNIVNSTSNLFKE